MEDVYEIIDFFYHEENISLQKMLLKHSEQVKNKALEILQHSCCSGLNLDLKLVINGAMLHDIGILKCYAPEIFCYGEESYIAHGIIGGKMLRNFGKEYHLDLERYARICERHTGAGLTIKNIQSQHLPIPERDYLPECLEEKLICVADKFYSKSGDMQEKSIDKIRKSMRKFGEDSLNRFDEMCQIFGI